MLLNYFARFFDRIFHLDDDNVFLGKRVHVLQINFSERLGQAFGFYIFIYIF